MKSVISTTYDNQYLFFLPIVTWCWNKIGVDVICFLPAPKVSDMNKLFLVTNAMAQDGMEFKGYYFNAPEHKQATYSQCSRLYGACLDLSEDELLITSDVDMAVFTLPPYMNNLTVFGSDLVPDGQYPMCYVSGSVKQWRDAMNLHNKTYQQCLDELLGDIECDHMRGNYWGKDQQTLWENIKGKATLFTRARQGTQFASHRVDRDDINWRAYVNEDLIDAHLWRPGYAEGNFENIMELLTMKYPDDDFTWLKNYNQQYKQLL